MLQSNMAVTIQNGRPEMFYDAYLSRYLTDNENFVTVFYISKSQDSESDILIKYEIQYGGYKLRWTPKIYISLRLY